jgi:hypothetical protein
MVGMPYVQAEVHGGDADRAGGGMVGAVRDAAEESAERQSAAHNLGQSLYGDGKYAEAERMFREAHGISMRVLGAEHPETLTCASEIANCLFGKGKHAEAEQINADLLRLCMLPLAIEGGGEIVCTHERVRMLRSQHALSYGKHLAVGLLRLSMLPLEQEGVGEIGRTHEHERVLRSQHALLYGEHLAREVLAAQTRVLGPEHPETLNSAASLAGTLFGQRKYTEAQPLLEATLEVERRVLGPAHPNTLNTASLLDQMRSLIRAAQPAAAMGNAARSAANQLPAGTRVLVQRLVAKPAHNGKRARVLSFDARTGRYAVVLDDGRELSLKAECVARAGCAAAGCASEEASSVCARCEAVRYCSRLCQRADWKAHKPACAAAAARAS